MSAFVQDCDFAKEGQAGQENTLQFVRLGRGKGASLVIRTSSKQGDDKLGR